MTKKEITRVMRENFPSCTIDRIEPSRTKGKSIVHITTATGNQLTFDIQLYGSCVVFNQL